MKHTAKAGADTEKILEDSIRSGRFEILEDNAKLILAEFGIPVVKDIRVRTPEQAVETAVSLGFPVVIKGIAPGLKHKTESGMVKTGITDSEGVRNAIEAMLSECLDRELSFLVQPQIPGRREFVAGMFKDPGFGPVIMFGLGGIYAEALNDTAFKIAPVDDVDMDDMFDQLMSKSLLGDFRGEKAVDMPRLRQILKGLSDLAMACPQIREIDINPVIIDPDGSPVAVDALILTQQDQVQPMDKPAVDPSFIRPCFYPKSIAFVGASASAGKWGHMLLTNTLSRNYRGRIFFVNPKTRVIAGKKVYSSIADIDSDIDLAVVTIPANRVIDLIPELAAKNTRGMLVITSGFKETGAAGEKMEKELVMAASDAGVLVLGPNTMGICNPHIDFFCSGVHVYPRPGSTALVCQSGNMGTQLLAFAEKQDIGIRAFSGSGNEAMVTIEDYMEAFEADDLTRTVVLYIESIKNGSRFFASASRVSKKKPVVVLKGGRTTQGTRAAASHTGAMATDGRVFDAACRQAGIVQVGQPMALLDLSAVFSSLPLPKGNRVAVMTLGGGWGVITTDLCEENNLAVPRLPDKVVRELDRILPDYWSRGNPVDIVGENDPSIPLKCVETLLQWDQCDAVIHLGIHGKRILANRMIDSIALTDPAYTDQDIEAARGAIDQVEKTYIQEVITLIETYKKPVLGVSLMTDETTRTLYRKPGSDYKAVFFPTPERAVQALEKMVFYNQWLEMHGTGQ